MTRRGALSVPTGRFARIVLAAVAVAALVAAMALPGAGRRLIVTAPLVAPDAIVSLASREWERLPTAAALAARYPRAVVILTVPAQVSEFNCHDCGHRAERLIDAGVDPPRIRVVPAVTGGTYGEAQALSTFVREHALHALMVVTSPYHTRRSLATFRTVLPPGVAVGVTPASPAQAHPDVWWSTAYDRWYVRYEWAAIVYYQLRHGVPL